MMKASHEEWRAALDGGIPLDADADASSQATYLWAGLHGRVALGDAIPTFPWPAEEEYIERPIELHITPHVRHVSRHVSRIESLIAL